MTGATRADRSDAESHGATIPRAGRSGGGDGTIRCGDPAAAEGDRSTLIPAARLDPDLRWTPDDIGADGAGREGKE